MKVFLERWTLEHPGGKIDGKCGSVEFYEVRPCYVCGQKLRIIPSLYRAIPGFEDVPEEERVPICSVCCRKVIEAGVKAIMQRPRKTGRRRT